MRYRIAGMGLEVVGERENVMRNVRGFEYFEDGDVDVDVVVSIVGSSVSVDEMERKYFLEHEGRRYSTYLGEGGEVVFEINDVEKSVDLTVEWLRGGRKVVIGGDGDEDMVLFALWLAYGVVGAGKGRLALHSSVVERSGMAVMFLGESGTGKSTHSRLWEAHIEGSRLLNDDSPILEVGEEGLYVHGSPWSGKTACYRRERMELAGVVRLSQSLRNEIRGLSVLEGFSALYPSCPPSMLCERGINDDICDMLSRVLSGVGVYHLGCLPDAAAAQMSYNAVFG